MKDATRRVASEAPGGPRCQVSRCVDEEKVHDSGHHQRDQRPNTDSHSMWRHEPEEPKFGCLEHVVASRAPHSSVEIVEPAIKERSSDSAMRPSAICWEHSAAFGALLVVHWLTPNVQ